MLPPPAAYTASPSVPHAWSGYTFWQYTDKDSVSGIKGGVDGDYFAGDMSSLKNLVYP